MNESYKAITSNVLSEEERKKFKIEILTLLESSSKEEMEIALQQLKKKVI